LEPLDEVAVTEYLAVRFPTGATDTSSLHELARMIHRRTEGNPLFMVNVVKDLVARGVIVQVGAYWELQKGIEEVMVEVPQSLRQLIEHQLERLSMEEQGVLEVASVAGAEFSVVAVAAGIPTETERELSKIEERCARLARREQVLQARGTVEWPDGTRAARYALCPYIVSRSDVRTGHANTAGRASPPHW
jgi:predicted ATPase